MAEIGIPQRPLRVAVVGSGPSGFFAAESLLKSLVVCAVDMFERLPVPFGLVRGGVAPDHPKIRSASRVFEKTAEHERFRFFGNVTVGRDITVEELRRFYDAVLLAYGAEGDRSMNVPGESLPESHAATEFVGWYNAHPDYRDRVFDLSCETAVIVGMGNVAMDVARMLAAPVDILKDTDIADYALDALAESRIREIHIVARRGPAQAKFTLPELKEMAEIPGATPLVESDEFTFTPACRQEIEASPGLKRIVEVLEEYSRNRPGNGRNIRFRFFLSPVAVLGKDRVEAMCFERTRLAGEPGNLKAWGTGALVDIPCGLVFRSVGYRGRPIPGVPFNEKTATIPHTAGRVEDNGREIPGLYVAGWIKRGPTGVIGTNKPDSLETVKTLLSDLERLTPCAEPDSQAVENLLRERGVRVVSFDDWKRIDAEEIARGARKGKPRERFSRVEDMLAVLDS
ncbi:MAG TPA: NADP oxidoreductase [Candidatus Hydrogenedentes bacterium]|nr:NADP oxidoreductase [Candidatus Hydrogenedentota bacterium]HPU97471.1 NADP oxidoreductase [Candidatus Hydrogenedentota bacterium]